MATNLFPKAPSARSILPEQPLVYHYASPNTVIGIISNKEVWGSKIQYLNDDKEFYEYISFLVRTAVDYLTIDNVSQKFSDAFTDRVERIRFASVYVASFSAEGDKLSQWRGYCPDGGYALGFDRELLKKEFESRGLRFEKAVYNLPEKDSVIKFVREVFEKYRGLGLGDATEDRLDEFFSDAMRKIVHDAPMFKHHGFKEEAEWRIFSELTPADDGQIDVVNIRGALRPIYKFKLPQTTLSDGRVDIGLRNIRVGPGVDAELRLDALRILLQRKGVAYEHITKSLIPYNAR